MGMRALYAMFGVYCCWYMVAYFFNIGRPFIKYIYNLK